MRAAYSNVACCAPRETRTPAAEPPHKALNLVCRMFVVSVMSGFASLKGFLGRFGGFVTRWMLPRCCHGDGPPPSPVREPVGPWRPWTFAQNPAGPSRAGYRSIVRRDCWDLTAGHHAQS